MGTRDQRSSGDRRRDQAPEYEIHSLGEYQALSHEPLTLHCAQYNTPDNQSTRECLVYFSVFNPVDH